MTNFNYFINPDSEKMDIKVSVVIPAFNAKTMLKKSIKSVLTQTFKPFEIIVVDDGSTDLTKEFVEANFSGVKVITQTNGGPSKARNAGVKAASGDYIAFLDADDEWYSDHLFNLISLLRKEINCSWAASGYKSKYLNKKESFNVYFSKIMNSPRKIIENFIVSSSSVIIKKTEFNRVGLFNEELKHGEDKLMWAKLLGINYRLAYTSKITVCYNINENSLSTINRKADDILKDKLTLVKDLIEFFNSNPSKNAETILKIFLLDIVYNSILFERMEYIHETFLRYRMYFNKLDLIIISILTKSRVLKLFYRNYNKYMFVVKIKTRNFMFALLGKR